MAKLSAYEREREANIARNRALLAELDMEAAVAQLGGPSKSQPPPKTKAKPIQPTKRVKKAASSEAPRRHSTRLRTTVVDVNESPTKKRKRLEEEEKRRKEEEDARLEAEEREREAKRPRHEDLDLITLGEEMDGLEVSALRTTFQSVTQTVHAKHVPDVDAYTFDSDKKHKEEVAKLRERLQGLKVVSRAKVTQNRVYSAAYHPEPTKDLVFFGDKHGQLGIWDARAPPDELEDDEDQGVAPEDREGGKYWRLQQHWPATSKSSISCIKVDPIDSDSIYTSSYDCTIRTLSFTSGISREIFTTEDALISSMDLAPSGHEMWISDALGGVIHLDLRQDKSKARWYALSDQKIGSVSVNPTNPHLLLTASNNRMLKIWDTRKFEDITTGPDDLEFDSDTVKTFVDSPNGKGLLRAEWRHDKSVSSAYWDPCGKSVVSTSYDDTLRLWNYKTSVLQSFSPFPSSRPFSQLKHNCQTGKWLTILRAQWSSNPDVYPHFTIGNMDHSIDIFSCKGDLIAKLSDRQRITAVQAVTCSHPSVVERVVSGNGSGRCVLWAPGDL
ncbi:hypothetical protein PLICRDRAFT_161539 [Plicaturopsis crispa FD-325 SS-3]|nr:hypothetical protein PLICRDRAFT_161539 [Plicaturopsis crispa FD-325 SS-3]